MASLTGNKIKDTYQSLLKTDDNGLVTNVSKNITDGVGNGSGLYLKDTGVTLSGSVAIAGISEGSQTNILTYDTASGQIYYTASNAIGGGGETPIDTGSFATTGSNVFKGSQTISGSISFGDGSLLQSISQSSGDGYGYSTLQLKPDAALATDQYIVLDPTSPNHIHVRAGGTIDASSAYLYLGGENTNVLVDDGGQRVQITTTDIEVQFLGYIDNGFGDGSGATLHVTSMINGTITDGMTIYGPGIPGGYTLQFGTVIAPQGDGGIGNYYLPGGDFLTTLSVYTGGTITTNNWNFEADGKLTMPGALEQGNNVLASGSYSHAQGFQTTASGSYSHAEGYNAQASGQGSHAEGNGRTWGVISHAEGDSTEAYGEASHAEGNLTYAIGQASHAEGYQTKTGTQNAYSASVVNGVVTLSGSYGDVASSFTTDKRLYLYDEPFDAAYPNRLVSLISQSYYNDPNTVVELYDTSVNTTTAYVGYFGADTSDIYNWNGDQTIPALWAHTEGNGTIALGRWSHAEGANPQAIGEYSHAEGSGTQAVGDASHAEGNTTQAIGGQSHAEGNQTKTIGEASHAEGQFTTAIGNFSHAEGDNTQTIGDYSHTEGVQTKTGTQNAYYAQSVVNGIITLSGSYGDVSGEFGMDNRLYLYDTPFDSVYNTATFIISQSYYSGSSNTIVELYDTSVNTTTAYVGDLIYRIENWTGDQTVPGDYSHTEGSVTIALGPYSHAEGQGTQAIGTHSHAEGYQTIAAGDRSHAEGQGTQAVGSHSHAEGRFTLSSGSWSHVEGNQTTAIEDFSHAEGDGTTAIGPGSHAEGAVTQTIGYASHAEGLRTTASGSYSHAEGTYTQAIGMYSHAEGVGSQNEGNPLYVQAIGTGSHAEGYITTAIGDYSHAAGLGTVSSGSYQSVIGQFNISSSAESAFIIGNGTSNGNRSNLLFASGSQVQITGSLDVSGSGRFTQFVTASAALFSGSGVQRLRVIGSGSTEPIMQVIGSQGELFTVTDSLSGSLFSVNDISGLPVIEVFSDSTVLIGSYQAPALNTTVLLPNTTAGVNAIYTVPTASYDAVYMDYVIRSGSVGRAGTFTAMWSGSSTSIADISVTPFGDTSGFVFGANISGSDLLISGSGTTAGWRVKTIIRSI